jgi:hypothetical protein
LAERHTHQEAAAVNCAQARQMEARGGDFLCWVPTMVFYAAVQVLDSRLADDNLHPRSQGDRLSYIRTYAKDFRAPAAYKDLQSLSESWRYDARQPRPDEIARAWRWAADLAIGLNEPWPPA